MTLVRGHITIHMHSRHTYTQSRRAAAPLAKRRMPGRLRPAEGLRPAAGSGSGHTKPSGGARSRFNKTKLVMLVIMQVVGRPMTSRELQKVWGGIARLEFFEYHLSCLVVVGLAELVIEKDELRFAVARALAT